MLPKSRVLVNVLHLSYDQFEVCGRDYHHLFIAHAVVGDERISQAYDELIVTPMITVAVSSPKTSHVPEHIQIILI